MNERHWLQTVVLSEAQLDGLEDPVLVEDLGDGWGLYEVSAGDALTLFGDKSSPTEMDTWPELGRRALRPGGLRAV